MARRKINLPTSQKSFKCFCAKPQSRPPKNRAKKQCKNRANIHKNHSNKLKKLRKKFNKRKKMTCFSGHFSYFCVFLIFYFAANSPQIPHFCKYEFCNRRYAIFAYLFSCFVAAAMQISAPPLNQSEWAISIFEPLLVFVT